MLNKAKQNQKQYTKLYKQFEKAFHKMYDFAQTNKVEGIEGSVHLVETIDLWSVEVEGCNDLNEQNNKLRAKLGLKEWEVID